MSLAPQLAEQTADLVDRWLADLRTRLASSESIEFRPKQVNDPVWGMIELLPWEVALLDTPLIQRMRGVRQLGLAQLVFPGANHGRLEHLIGVIGAAEEVLRSLRRQIERWNRSSSPQLPLPHITDAQGYAIRMAALLHDIGHGPFSHAIEPVLASESPLGTSTTELDYSWRLELKEAGRALKEIYGLDDDPAVSEVIAVFFVLAPAMWEVFASDKVMTDRQLTADAFQEKVAAAIVGAIKGPGGDHLNAIISSQIDADRLDYLARDAHHAGLEIGFDTARLLSRLEVLRVREDKLASGAVELRSRAANSTDQMFYQIGISAAGFGSFEQMLIGRTFLYDRLYHHHKVRAAEAMAQRLLLVAERDRNKRFDLKEIFLDVEDDTYLRIFAGDVTHGSLAINSVPARALASSILNRRLLNRAFAFRGRFISVATGQSDKEAEANRKTLWLRIVDDLENLEGRYQVGVAIHDAAIACCEAIKTAGVDIESMQRYAARLAEIGPEQIIVDLPDNKAGAIRILARYPDGMLRVPEFSFNPHKWSEAYELQKRTGYVFCPRDVAKIIGLAAKIVFLSRYGATMGKEADGYIKADDAPTSWLQPLIEGGVIDDLAAQFLTHKRQSLVAIRAADLKIPAEWTGEDPDFDVRLAEEIQAALQAGLTADHLEILGRTLASLFAFVDAWFSGGQISADLPSEAALQQKLKDAFIYRDQKVAEGSEMSGGESDLIVDDAVVVENKWASGQPSDPFPSAGMQGRRYAIGINSQIVVVVGAVKVGASQVPSKPSTISVQKITSMDKNRVEIRFLLPYGAPVPSKEKPDRS